jgi:hypothetical protein
MIEHLIMQWISILMQTHTYATIHKLYPRFRRDG